MNAKIRMYLVVSVVATLATAGLLSGWAAYWIYSNTAITQVGEYSLTLSAPSSAPRYTNITLTAILLYQSLGVLGKTIVFYLDTGAFSEIGTNVTDSSGTATLQYNVTSLGALNFRAGYQVTP